MSTQAENLREFLRKRITNISTAAEDDIIALFIARQNALLDAVVADAPKDAHTTVPELKDYTEGWNDTNKKWRDTVQRHKVKEREL